MASITLRTVTGTSTGASTKGSPLTATEVDNNFDNLNAQKLEKSNNLSDLTSVATARTNLGVDAAGTAVALSIALG